MQSHNREQQHTKLFDYHGRQVSARIQRDGDDDLCVVLQMWVAASDEQIQALIKGQDDDATAAIFAGLTQDTIAKAVEDLKLPEIMEEVSADGE